jgi:hypothetical protein
MAEKRYYAVKRCFMDTINGVTGRPGEVVFTNCESWVARLGSSLESTSPPEEGTIVLDVQNTKEDEDTPATEIAPDAQAQRKALARQKANRMITVEESQPPVTE